MRIFVLMENTARPGSGCASEHGLSLLLEYEGHRLLFDTGASPLFLRNASLLGVDAERVEAAALSHGHYDHGGGLPAYLMRGEAPVYVQAAAFRRRGSLRPNGEMAEIGLDPGLRGAPRLRLLAGNREILPGALLFADVDLGSHTSGYLGRFGEDFARALEQAGESVRLRCETV